MASQEVGLATVLQNIAKALDADEIAIAEQLIMPALDQFPQLPQLWFHAGNCYFAMDKQAMASVCYERALELEPVAAGMGNLGAVYRRMGRHDEAMAMLTRAADIDPDQPQVWNNIAACYINEGQPEVGLVAIKKALDLDPGFSRAHWNAALLYLEAGNLGQGFKEYRWGIGKDRILKGYGDLEYLPADYAPNPDSKTRLIVTGEQGIGDELMFGSLLNLASKDFEITFDCHPRLVDLFQDAYPGLDIRPTRKVDPVPWEIDHDYHISIADLAAYYVKKRGDLTRLWKNHGPFYQVEEAERNSYRLMLEALAEGRKIIGLATRGGVIKTNRHYRTLKPDNLDAILADDRYFFVSLDYEDVDPMLDHINEKWGEDTIQGFRAVTHHFNYARTAALVAATDAVVTVCQSVFHLSAGMGHPTLCLVPDRPAWRYGMRGKRHFWYQGKNIRLFRQKMGQPWDEPVQHLADYLEVMLRSKHA